MSPQEQVLEFGCASERLLGILSLPDAQASTSGVVIVVGGPQYRAGSHRQFVQLARALARAGAPCLRFDLRGMGDSSGAPQGFEASADDIAAAVTALLQAQPQLRRVVLWGLCDAASATLLYWDQTRDPRVAGLCLANPWVRSAASLAATHIKHYYLQRLQSTDFWRKLFSGAVAWRAVSELLASLRLAARRGASPHLGSNQALSFQDRMARAWRQFDGPMLLLLSGEDYTAKEFLQTVADAPAWHAALDKAGLSRRDLARADHTFSALADQQAAEQLTVDWLAGLPPATLPQKPSIGTFESCDTCS